LNSSSKGLLTYSVASKERGDDGASSTTTSFALSPGEAAALEPLGVNARLVEFVAEMAARPETWQHFPIDDYLVPRRAGDEPLIELPFEMTPHRLQHVMIMLKLVAALRKLRYDTCPRLMTELLFWHIYFLLVADSLDKSGCDLLLNPRRVALTSVAPRTGASPPAAAAGGGGGATAAVLAPLSSDRRWSMRVEQPLRPLTEPATEHMGIWDFITASEHATDADLDEFERVACDPSLYLSTNWRPEYVTNLEQLKQFRANHTLGALLRRGVPDWLGATARGVVWRIACGIDDEAQMQREVTSIYRRVFGPNVPDQCARIPTFGGWYRPDQHTALSASQIDASSRLLVALALDNTNIAFAPQLPDLCLALMRHLDEFSVFAVLNYLLRISRAVDIAILRAAGAGGGSDARGSSGSGSAGATANAAAAAPSVPYLVCSVRMADALGCLFMELVAHCLPDVAEHLENLRIGAIDFADAWLKRFFVDALPDSVVSRIIDAYLLEGVAVLHIVGIALLHLLSPMLLKCGTADKLLNMLKVATRTFDNGELLMQTAFSCAATRSLVARLLKLHLSGEARSRAPSSARPAQSKSAHSPPMVRAVVTRPQLTSSAAVILPPAVASASAAARMRTCSNLSFYRPRIRDLSRVFSQQHFEILWNWLPLQLRALEPVRLYSTDENGCSLNTFFNLCSKESPTLLLIRTSTNAVFGAFAAHAWAPQHPPRFFGTGESFVFRMEPQPVVYRWARGNEELFQIATRDHIAMGGNAIWLDDELLNGHSHPDQTFANECLVSPEAHAAKQYGFQIASLEVYALDEAGALSAAEQSAPLAIQPAQPAPRAPTPRIASPPPTSPRALVKKKKVKVKIAPLPPPPPNAAPRPSAAPSPRNAPPYVDVPERPVTTSILKVKIKRRSGRHPFNADAATDARARRTFFSSPEIVISPEELARIDSDESLDARATSPRGSTQRRRVRMQSERHIAK
jgi:hypothetical protein